VKGDFTRVTFRPERHYDGVRMQQGRVQLDADFNEEAEIREYLEAIEGIDVIGRCGVPKTGGGFAVSITSDGRDVVVSPGRLYVDGLLCENDEATVAVTAVSETASTATVERLDAAGREFRENALVELLDGGSSMGTATISAVDESTRTLTLAGAGVQAFLQGTHERSLRLATTYSTQPHWPEPDPLDPPVLGSRTDLVYLDVWQRHVTAVEDPDLLESALGGVDTGTRVQTVWQVRVLPDVGSIDCDDDIAGWPPAPSDGRLTNDTVPGPADDDPCVVPPGGGYTGIENRLYRVEVHQGTEPGKTETFKWSRENGSLAFPIDEFVDGGGPATEVRLHRLGRDETLGLRADDWVEYVDDATELAGLPGRLVQIESVDELERVVTLSGAVGPAETALHPKLRRWDQPSDALAIVGGTRFALENGIEVEFAGDDLRSGDYWVFAARTASGQIEPLVEAPPRGIRHHYCRLALVTWEERTTTDTGTTEACILRSVAADCRVPFPPLTDICAEDVCFDNTTCGLTDVETVQDALDRICGEQDLRFHKRHLHGWGIVCGLQVQCVGDACPDVEVRNGYAIDCEGRDIVLRDDERIGVLDLIRTAENGNGSVPDGAYSLFLGLDDDLKHTFGVERYEPAKEPLKGLFRGTLLWDVWEDCILKLVEFYKQQFTVPTGTTAGLVSPAQKRLTTFLNLLYELQNPAGRYVFLSKREDAILRDFYAELRKLLTSSTFCAMFHGARPFPDYPSEWDPMPTTAFGRAFHKRLRLDPTGERGFTCGEGNEIHVFDLATDELVEVLEFPAGPKVVVRDVVTIGGDLYAIAVQDGNTLFGIADYDRSKALGKRHSWRSMNVSCNVELLSLGMSASIPDTVYAVGGTNLWSIEPDAQNPAWTSVVNLTGTAAGPLAIVDETSDGRTASAYMLTGVSTGYDTLVRQPLKGGTATTELIPLADKHSSPESPLSGDDLAVAFGSGVDTVAVVVKAKSGQGPWLLLYDIGGASPYVPTVVKGLEALGDTETRVVYDDASGYFLVSSADAFRLTPVTPAGVVAGDDDPYRHPVQIGPISLAAASERKRVYALNQLSRTISSIEAGEVPSSPSFDLPALVKYRHAVLGAFADLLGGFVQYLKDCVCDHFLVDCPTCDGDEKLYLAAIELRNGDIYHVCNFSKRRYVKSFPTVEYWLSAVPVLPLLHYAVEKICCAVLPPHFGRFDADKWRPRGKPVPVHSVVGGVTRVGRAIPQVRRDAGARVEKGRETGVAWIGSHLLGEPRRHPQDLPLAAAEAGTDVAAELASLRAEVERLRGRQESGFASRDKKIATLRSTVERLQAGSQ
jgi:Family of unknown function (DUF6519)